MAEYCRPPAPAASSKKPKPVQEQAGGCKSFESMNPKRGVSNVKWRRNFNALEAYLQAHGSSNPTVDTIFPGETCSQHVSDTVSAIYAKCHHSLMLYMQNVLIM